MTRDPSKDFGEDATELMSPGRRRGVKLVKMKLRTLIAPLIGSFAILRVRGF